MHPLYLISCLDFDGCSDTHQAQMKIIKHIISSYKEHPSIRTIYVIIASLRQSLILDVLNAQRNSKFPDYISCSILYDIFLPQLQSEFNKLELGPPPKIEFCPFLTSDIYNQLPTGTTFQSMKTVFSWIPYDIERIRDHTHSHLVKNQKGDFINLLSSSSHTELVDCTKVSTIYAQAHYFANHLTDGPILMQFYDDKEIILSGVHQFYLESPQYLPRHLTLELIHNVASELHTTSRFPIATNEHQATTILGMGEVQPRFHEQIYQLGLHHSWKSIPEGYVHEPEVFYMLQNAEIPDTQTQTFETYPMPSQNMALPIEHALTPELPLRDYSDIVIPDVLPDHMSVYQFYDHLITDMHEIYMSKCRTARIDFTNKCDAILNLHHYDEIFELAFEIKKLEQLRTSSSEVSHMTMEFEDLLLAVNEDSYFVRTESDEYATIRCEYEDKIAYLEHQYKKIKHEKIASLAWFLHLSAQEFIQKMEQHRFRMEQQFFHPPKIIMQTLEASQESNTNHEYTDKHEDLSAPENLSLRFGT